MSHILKQTTVTKEAKQLDVGHTEQCGHFLEGPKARQSILQTHRQCQTERGSSAGEAHDNIAEPTNRKYGTAKRAYPAMGQSVARRKMRRECALGLMVEMSQSLSRMWTGTSARGERESTSIIDRTGESFIAKE
jgi:hypothetical protein